MPALPAKCTDVIIERHIHEAQVVISGYSGTFNLLDVNDVPMPAIYNPIQIGAMTGAQRDANSFLQKREEGF